MWGTIYTSSFIINDSRDLKMKVVIGALFSILLIGVLAQGQPAISIMPDSVNFGMVPKESNLFQKFVMKSIGTDTLIIDSVRTVCECIKMPFSKKILAPGDSFEFELSYATEDEPGDRIRSPYIYYNGVKEAKRLPVKAFLVTDIDMARPVCAKPFKIMASQFGLKPIATFPFSIINESADTIPLRLVISDNEFFDVKFPVFVPARGRAEGEVVLNQKGLQSEFEKSFTFEFITGNSEARNYSIPVIRKIYKK